MPTTGKHVLVFLAAACPTFICHFCEEEVEPIFICEDRVPRNRTLVVHHIDGDPENNVPANLAPAHAGCHSRHHIGFNHAGRDRRAEQLRRFAPD